MSHYSLHFRVFRCLIASLSFRSLSLTTEKRKLDHIPTLEGKGFFFSKESALITRRTELSTLNYPTVMWMQVA